MFGFSLPKLLVLAAIILVVWYGFKWVGQIDKQRKAAVKERERADARLNAEDMVKCPRCDTFVAAKGATACDRADCPYPG